jgi:hypothetical protein
MLPQPTTPAPELPRSADPFDNYLPPRPREEIKR